MTTIRSTINPRERLEEVLLNVNDKVRTALKSPDGVWQEGTGHLHHIRKRAEPSYIGEVTREILEVVPKPRISPDPSATLKNTVEGYISSIDDFAYKQEPLYWFEDFGRKFMRGWKRTRQLRRGAAVGALTATAALASFVHFSGGDPGIAGEHVYNVTEYLGNTQLHDWDAVWPSVKKIAYYLDTRLLDVHMKLMLPIYAAVAGVVGGAAGILGGKYWRRKKDPNSLQDNLDLYANEIKEIAVHTAEKLV